MQNVNGFRQQGDRPEMHKKDYQRCRCAETVEITLTTVSSARIRRYHAPEIVFATKYWRQYTRAKLFPQHSHPSQRESSRHHVGQRQKTASLVRTRAKFVLMSMQIANSPKRNRTWFSPISTLSLDTSPTKKASFVLSNQQAGFQV